MAEPDRELLARLAYAEFLYAQARRELAYNVLVHKTQAVATMMAHEQVQEKRLEILSQKDEPPLGKLIYDAFLMVSLTAVTAASVQAVLRSSMGRFQGAFGTQAAERAVQVTRFRVENTTRTTPLGRGPSQQQLFGGTRPYDPRVDPPRPPSSAELTAAAQTMRFADAISARLTLGELHAYQEKLSNVVPLIEGLTKSPALEEAIDPLPPDIWPTEAIVDVNQYTREGPRRLLARGFKADAGRTAASIQIREQAEVRAMTIEHAADEVLAELGFTLDLARMLAWGADPAVVKAALGANKYAHPLLDDPLPVQELTEMLISDLLLIASPNGDSPGIPLDRVRDDSFLAMEKCIWMALYGSSMTVPEGRVPIEDKARDDRRIHGVPEGVVQYWWARFKNSVTGRPFPNRVLLFEHLKQFKLETEKALKLLEKIREATR